MLKSYTKQIPQLKYDGIRLFSGSYRMLNDRPQSPLKVFFDTFKSEVKKSNELKENIKALQDETGRLGESDAFRRAKEAYDRAQKGSSAASKVASKAAEQVGDVAYKAWESDIGKGVRRTVKSGAQAADKAFEPVRKTQVYRDVSEIIDDGSSTAYGGFLTKEQRERLRKKELEQRLKSGKLWRPTKEDEGNLRTDLVATEHKATGPSTSDKWEQFKLTNPIGKSVVILKEKWDESENSMISLIRTIFEKISGFFAETEQAKVVKQFKMMDPNFRLTDFQKSLTNYIVPELLDAYISNDEKILQQWLSEAPFNVWKATNKQFVQQGVFSDSKILDIRGVEIVTCRLLQPSNVPVVVVSCRAQEIHLYRNIKSGKVTAGTEDNIQLSTYAMVFTRTPEELGNDVTDGWKVLEFARGGSRPFH